jgi:hypothetical protein
LFKRSPRELSTPCVYCHAKKVNKSISKAIHLALFFYELVKFSSNANGGQPIHVKLSSQLLLFWSFLGVSFTF